MDSPHYHGKNDILNSVSPLGDELRAVQINRDRLAAFSSRIDSSDFPEPHWDLPFIYPYPDEVGVDYFILMNALNFCYWVTRKWTMKYKDKTLDGAWGMFAALKRAIEEGLPIHDGPFLASIGWSEIKRIFRGKGEIPLLEQHLTIYREVGRVLIDNFNGRFYHLVKAAEGSAAKLVRLLVSYFPSFDDSAEWGGHRLLFYKRAQLAPAMLFERWKGTGAGAFNDIGELTASANYMILQVLRRLAILEYSPDLSRFVDEKRRIPSQ